MKRKAGAECIPLQSNDRKRHQTNNLGDSLRAALGIACELTKVWRHDISWQATMVRGAKRVRPSSWYHHTLNCSCAHIMTCLSALCSLSAKMTTVVVARFWYSDFKFEVVQERSGLEAGTLACGSRPATRIWATTPKRSRWLTTPDKRFTSLSWRSLVDSHHAHAATGSRCLSVLITSTRPTFWPGISGPLSLQEG